MVISAGTDPFDKAPSLINIVSMQCRCQNWGTLVIIVSWLRVVLLGVGGWQHWLCWRGSRGLILQSYICTVITDSELRRNHRPGSHILTPSHLSSSWGAAASPVCFTQNVNVMFSVLHFLVWPLLPPPHHTQLLFLNMDRSAARCLAGPSPSWVIFRIILLKTAGKYLVKVCRHWDSASSQDGSRFDIL